MTLPKLFDWYSEDFGGKDKVLLWLLGVVPEGQRQELCVLIEAEYDSPFRELSTAEMSDGRRRHDSVDSNTTDTSTDSRSTVVRSTRC